MNSAAIADALIAKSRGILTRPRQERADALTVRLPRLPVDGGADVQVIRIEAHRDRFGHAQD